MTLTLHGLFHPEAACIHRVLVAASFANVQLKLEPTSHCSKPAIDEFRRNCHPSGHLPVLQTEEGYIFSPNAILRHIARCDKGNSFLYGRTPFESSQVDMWLDYTIAEFITPLEPVVIAKSHDKPLPENAATCATEGFRGLETWLETRTFLVGERMTIADISIAFALQLAYRFTGSAGEELAKKYKNVYRLYNTVMQQPKTVEVLKEQGATFGPVKVKKEAAAQPKAEKKKEKKEEDEDEDEALAAPPPKPKNPLDELPPSPFVLDAFKREYSNKDTLTEAAPYFFKNFDPAGYTCFWATYKYNEENKMQFMTGNLVAGWFQRMEHLRKYAFGIALIIGEPTAHDIVTFWMFRGKGLPDIVKEVSDVELYEWVEIPDINAAKQQITDYLNWEGATIPKPVLEGRCFK